MNLPSQSEEKENLQVFSTYRGRCIEGLGLFHLLYRLSSVGGAAPERLSGTTASPAPPVCREAEQRRSLPHGLWLRKLPTTHSRIWQSEPLHPFEVGLFPTLQVFYLWIGKCCNEMFIRDVLGCPDYASIPPNMVRKTAAYLKSHINSVELLLQLTCMTADSSHFLSK